MWLLLGVCGCSLVVSACCMSALCYLCVFGVICLVVFGWQVRVFRCRFAGFCVVCWFLLWVMFVAGLVGLFVVMVIRFCLGWLW